VIAPTAPSNLYANGARRKVILSWTASTDTGGSGLAGYEVWRATSAAGPFTLIAQRTTTGYQDTSVTSRVPYWYVAYAYDAAGNRSGASNTVSATPN
jgi:fibronectin type 3 domain-containing protein